MRKKLLALFLILTLCFDMVTMTACKKYETPENTETPNNEQTPTPVHTHLFGTWVEENKATCKKAGNIAYKECTSCKKKFDMEDKEISDITLPIDKTNHVTTETEAESNENGTHNVYYACCYELKTENVTCTTEIAYNDCTRTERCICGEITKMPAAAHNLAPKQDNPDKMECITTGCDHEEDAP